MIHILTYVNEVTLFSSSLLYNIIPGCWANVAYVENFSHLFPVLIPREMVAVECLNLTEMYNKVNATTKRIKKKLPFIVRQPISSFIIQCKPLQEKENEWTHRQICQWLSKCQIRPNLSCLDEWQALGRVSLRLLSFPHKKVRYPMRDRVCQTDHRAAALSREKLGSKKFVTK